MARFGLVGPSYVSESPLADAETLVNWYVENMESQGARSSATLYPRPGLSAFVTLPQSPVRGMLEIDDRLFAVAGAGLYEVVTPIVTGNIASISTAGGANPTVIMFVNATGQDWSGIQAGDPLTVITTPSIYNGTFPIVSIDKSDPAAIYITYVLTGFSGSAAVGTSGSVTSHPHTIPVYTSNYIGYVANDGKPASMAASPQQLLVASGGNAYYMELASRFFQPVAALNAGGAASLNWTISIINVSGTAYPISHIQTGGGTDPIVTVTIDVSSLPAANRTAMIAAGDLISVNSDQSSFNGTYTITNVDKTHPSSALITYIRTGATTSAYDNTATGQATYNVLQIQATTGVRITPGMMVTVTQCSQPLFNGTWTVGNVDGTSTIVQVYCHATSAILAIATIYHDGELIVAGHGVLQTAFIDGYFAVLFADSQYLRISALFDATSWDAADVARVQFYPENIASLLIDHREAWLLGRNKTVVYYDSGAALFPFDVVSGGYIEQGCAATFSPVRADNSIFWLGRDDRGALVAWRANGYLPARVSTHALENEWQSYATAEDAISMSYQWNGHTFWQIYFPTANRTWVYDCSNSTWHRDGFWNGSDYDAHRAAYHAFAFGKHLVGDPLSGNIYQMVEVASLDFGNPIRWERRAPSIGTELEFIRHDRLVVDTQLTGGTLNVRWSDDATATWSNVHTIDCNPATGKLRPPPLRRLGRSRQRIYELSSFDPLRIIDGYVDAAPGFAPQERFSKNMAKMA